MRRLNSLLVDVRLRWRMFWISFNIKTRFDYHWNLECSEWMNDWLIDWLVVNTISAICLIFFVCRVFVLCKRFFDFLHFERSSMFFFTRFNVLPTIFRVSLRRCQNVDNTVKEGIVLRRRLFVFNIIADDFYCF